MKNTTNVFLKGMTSDMHPLTTSQLEYTDALNATLITFNGNEQMMQNDMGNTRIQDSKTGNIMGLREGFIPIGMKEHGGIMYIASVNNKGEGEIGTIPSPVITYLPLDDEESKIEFISWVADNDESPIFTICDKELNPEEIFIIGIKDPANLHISSLNNSRLYIPHLIAITPNGEKDITPAVAVEKKSDEFWWFKSDINTDIDLEVLNQPTENSPIDDIKLANFLSYPKIQSGKLGIKFTKENIKEFGLAPNGDSDRCYPVLAYKDIDGVRNYYALIYGVRYTTNSEVTVNSFEISHTIENSSENSNPILWRVTSNNDETSNELFNIENYAYKIVIASGICYITRISNSDISWPESNQEFNNNTPYLYKIDLGTNPNQWITIKIKYWKDGWNNELGEYTMLYNPYYMDTLKSYIVNKYCQIHTFANNKTNFPQYRHYINGNQEAYTIVKSVESDTFNGEIQQTVLKSVINPNQKFQSDDNRYISLPFDYNSLKFSTIFTNLLSANKKISSKNTTYLRQILEKSQINSNNLTITGITFKCLLTELSSFPRLGNTAGRKPLELKGSVEIGYKVELKKLDDVLIPSQNEPITNEITNIPLISLNNSSTVSFYKGSKLYAEEIGDNVFINYPFDIKFSISSGISVLNPETTIQTNLEITNFETKGFQHYTYNESMFVHDLQLTVRLIILACKTESESFNILVPYKSDCSVYPLADACVDILNLNNDIESHPAYIDNEGNYYPLKINTKNLMNFKNGLLVSSNTRATGYTKGIDDETIIQGSFNLNGLELFKYIENGVGVFLENNKYYIFNNNDLDLQFYIDNENNKIESTCVIKGDGENHTIKNKFGYYRSVGIYEIIGDIKSNINDVSFINNKLSSFTIDNIELNKCALQTVYCYTEDTNTRKTYKEGIVTKPFMSDSSVEYSKDFICNPVPEFGYQTPILVYEKNTDREYKRYLETSNEVINLEIFDRNGNPIKFRFAPKYNLITYPLPAIYNDGLDTPGNPVTPINADQLA